VIPSGWPELAINQFLVGDFDLVILGDCLHPEERDRLCRRLRQHTSRTPIVSIARHAGDRDPYVDATVASGPAQLIAGLRELVNGNGDHGNASPRRTNGAAGGNGRKETILFADDDPGILDSWRALLQHAGYRVLAAPDGPEALRLFSTEAVDAVVLDYEMPGMNGATVAAQIRQIKSGVPLILFSTLLTVPNDDLALFNCHVSKGDSFAVLMSAIEEALPSLAS
jgi:CheY-like chemotaxis protein